MAADITLKNINAVILCGGLGKRLRSVVGESQKIMAQVDGQPFLDILLTYLKIQGIKRVVLCTGYKADSVEHYYRENTQGLTIEFSREEEPLGTGGALKNAQNLIKSDSFFLLNGDSFCAADLNAFFDFHQIKKSMATVAVSKVTDGKDYGTITLDPNFKITAFKEKDQKSANAYVNAGIYCFNKQVFSLMPDQQKFSLECDLFPKLVNKDLYGFVIKEEFFDIGTPERYNQIKNILKKG